MGFWGSVGSSINNIQTDEEKEIIKNQKQVLKYKAEIEKTRAIIKAKKEAFYKNLNLKDK